VSEDPHGAAEPHRPPATRSPLRALGWDHPRCMLPMTACAQAWAGTGRGAVAWEARSLEAFGDQPLEEIAADYDLLVIDHPFCGAAERSGCLTPIDELLEPEVLAAVSGASIGPSQSSYEHRGHVWALASDAACQVSAWREPDATHEPPATWPEALEVMHRLGHRAALPLSPAHAISSLLTLWAGSGLEPATGGRLVDPERGLEQLEWLLDMHRCGHPASTSWEPPAALTALVAGELDYIPLTYGYVSYSARPPAESSRHGARAPRACRFSDIPGATGAVLGGAGLAVSADSRRAAEAAEFAAWACSPEVQGSIVAPAGGQPASRACWEDSALDAAAGGFYSATRATMEGAWVRPRDAWWQRFQLEAGRALSAGLQAGTPPGRLLEALLAIHHETALRSGALR
jgi:multiple sugar transport system substrate-binding protein